MHIGRERHLKICEDNGKMKNEDSTVLRKVKGYHSNIRRSITGENDDDYIHHEPIVLERIDLSNVDSLLGGHVMPNTNLSTQFVQDQPALQEFIPSHPEALGRNGEENGKADLSFLREEIQNLGFLCFFSQPKTLQPHEQIEKSQQNSHIKKPIEDNKIWNIFWKRWFKLVEDDG
ncbi:hypothetical protein MTR_0094s0020 [Medicago truncatula]|uniref:Uncharacterized protein n=1 Tax=Medicago truncatula TaxID=3880 RepID=A0A072TIP6_MEDTR|nr:hypothetical protein MTR_0094s0020 [Medicago truncatula]